MSEPRQYELIYVIAPDVDDAGVAELHARVEGIVTAGGGQIDKTDNWGRRRLAYEIDRHREGTYVLELFTGSGAIVAELDRRLKVADNVLRFLIVRVDEDLRKAEHARARRQSKRKQRQSARSAAPAPEAAPVEAPAAEAAEPATEPPAKTDGSGDEPAPAAEVSE
ncbi:MAG: 30S ribosomal protein S6 [Acidobacteria bacterium]|nr:30S ribosomal protein S6 [Acidobacteriota bacterium]